ncbi:MAG: esterase/lipase family protein [Planctomycetota bacterium]|jgi:pimeloyl-ACP methyl ester carboxylesterase
MRPVVLLLVFAACSGIGVKTRSQEAWYEGARRSILNSDDVSDVTHNLLRLRSLHWSYEDDPVAAILKLVDEIKQTRERQLAVAIAELGYLQSKRWTKVEENALHTTLRYSYAYLFDPRLEPAPEQFDGQFRWACDLYTAAAADLIRAAKREDWDPSLEDPFEWYGGKSMFQMGVNELDWEISEFDQLSVTYDFGVEGLPDPDSRRGFGVPCVLRRTWDRQSAVAGREPGRYHYLPRNLAFSATLVVRFPDGTSVIDEEQPDAIIEVRDPSRTVALEIEGRRVPLEVDYTTPVAIVLSGQEQKYGVSALLRGDKYAQQGGLYMFQPYDDDKIFILLVHGLASDPLTWLPMYSTLMAHDTIRTRCQFAFWFYPTGQPILYSAYQLREALAEARVLLSPDDKEFHDDFVLMCGHSMGGVLTRSMVVDTGSSLYDVCFDKPLGDLELSDRDRGFVQDLFVFDSLPFVNRAIFYATPHRGSPTAKRGIAEWASGFVTLPGELKQQGQRIVGAARPELRRKRMTSIQSLRSDNPLTIALADLPIHPRVTYHSIIGDTEASGRKGGSDGIVPYESSHVPGAESELIVNAGHSVQHTPEAMRETIRIILEHIAAYDALQAGKR